MHYDWSGCYSGVLGLGSRQTETFVVASAMDRSIFRRVYSLQGCGSALNERPFVRILIAKFTTWDPKAQLR